MCLRNMETLWCDISVNDSEQGIKENFLSLVKRKSGKVAREGVRVELVSCGTH